MSKVILTIDDGPTKQTHSICDLLQKKNIGAVMFFIGKGILEDRKLCTEAIDMEFIIGNHSFSHPNMSIIPATEGFKEIEATQKIISKLYEERSKKPYRIFRFPYGMFTKFPMFKKKMYNKYLQSRKFIPQGVNYHWLWNTNFKDGESCDLSFNNRFDRIEDKVSKMVENDVVLMHDSIKNFDSGFFSKTIQATLDAGHTFYSNKEIHTYIKNT